MVGVKKAPSFLSELEKALVEILAANGIRAKVRAERVTGTKLYRVGVFSRQFKAMRHSERQNVVWRIAEKALSPEDQMRISMILTLTPYEAKGR